MNARENAASLKNVRVAAGERQKPSPLLVMCWLQGIYYFMTGVWPLLSMETFLMVTGPKTDNLKSGLIFDHWLVKTVGVLITAIAVATLLAAWRRAPSLEIAVLNLSAAIGLTAIDVIYVWRQMILPIYLLDAAVEIVLIVVWLWLLWNWPHNKVTT